MTPALPALRARPDRRWIPVAALALALFVTTFSFDASLIRGGLDASWIFAVNHFFDKGIIVGADEIFTYGPLGFVVYPQPIGRNLELALAVHALSRLCAAIALVAAYVVARPQRPLAHAIPMSAAALLLLAFGGAPPFGVLRCSLIVAAVLVMAADRLDRATLFLAAAPFAAFGLLTKPFYGACALTLLGAAMVVRMARRQRFWPPLAAALLAIALCMLAYLAMYSTVRGFDMYLRSIVEMSRGYFTAMPSLGAVDTAWLLGMPACLAAVGWLCRRERRAMTALILLLPTIYLAIRYGVTKQPRECIALCTVASLLLLLELPRLRSWPPVAALLLLGLYSFNLHTNTGTPERWSFDALGFIWRDTVLRGPRELRDKAFRFAGYREWALQTSRSMLARDGAIDDRLRDRLRPRSVDGYPHDFVWIPANGLSWRPRPVPQSYAANTPWLDGLDANFLDGARAPDLYLWGTGPDGAATLTGLDGRLVLNDEPRAVLMLLRHYRVTDWTGPGKAPFLVLERSTTSLLGESRAIGTAQARMNEWVAPPQTRPGILRARIAVRRTTLGALARTFWYEPKTIIQYIVSFGNKEWVEERRLPVDNAALGVWISPFLLDLTASAPLLGVKAFRIVPSAPARFASAYEVEWVLTDVHRVPPPDWRSLLH